MRDLSLPAEQRSENTRGVEVQEKRRDIFLLKPSHRLGSFLSLWGSNRQHMVTQVIYHCHCPLPEKKPATQDVTINPERKATVQAPQAFNSQDLVCHGLLILLMEEIRLACWHGYIYMYISHYLPGFIRPMWCGISSINKHLWNSSRLEICRTLGWWNPHNGFTFVWPPSVAPKITRNRQTQEGNLMGNKQQRFLRQDLWRISLRKQITWFNLHRRNCYFECFLKLIS